MLNKSYTLDLLPTQDASGKKKMFVRDPLLKI